MYHGRSKYIDIQHHFVCKAIKMEHITTKNQQTSSMIADYLTKTIHRFLHEMRVHSMNLKLLLFELNDLTLHLIKYFYYLSIKLYYVL